MCGIVGLFLKDKKLEPDLGNMLTDMLITMTDRGPDSAGIAIYGQERKKQNKLTIQSNNPEIDFPTLADDLGAALGCKLSLIAKDTHAVLHIPAALIRRSASASALHPRKLLYGRQDAIALQMDIWT